MYIKWQFTWFVIYSCSFLNSPSELTFWIILVIYGKNPRKIINLDDPSMIAKYQETVDRHRRFISLILISPTNNRCCVLTATLMLVIMLNKGKGKAVPLQAWSGPEISRKLRFPDYMTTAQDGGKVVSPAHRPPLPPGNAPGTYFRYRLSRPQGHSVIGRILCQ